ncbi:helix-turn-helix domain-containing protein [Clostridium sp. C105KSO13]|uniref:helix-turn-helix domain-containing protein n=1 Tax=Clostridium sp. C105KSO13 TaxID=1776045 RepID=UPI0007407DB3|nr:AraC family transcriptional regulator [Clostridium sp. C105KSO13]CUX16394.1 HTH-type transcriptional activator Btr [Clostridium sp. C105KSO13]
MYEIFDEFCWSKQKKTITKDKHHVPGLGNFSHWNYTTSSTPSPMHYHSDIIEVHCLLKGTRYTQIEKDGQIKKYTTMGNQAFLTFPFEMHSNGNEPLAPCEFYAFQINTSDPYNMLGLNREYSFLLYQQLVKLKDHHLNMGATHISTLRSAFNFFSDLTPESTMIGIQFLTCFILNLQFMTPIQESQISQVEDSIKRAIDYLTANIHRNIQLSDLAEISGYSLSRFKYKFKESIGITPAEYVTLQKLEVAKTQLLESPVSITELAYSLGFSSSNYFSSVFKKFTGCTPQFYRKQYSFPMPEKRGNSIVSIFTHPEES